MNTYYIAGQPAGYGDFKPAILYGNGPASYSAASGDPLANPAAGDYICFPSDCTTQSGNYSLTAFPASVTPNQPRAGGGSPSQSGWSWIWKYSGKQGVATVVVNAAGSGMTPGTVTPLAFSGGGGSGAAGTFTVLTATTGTIAITSYGGGYTSAPTVTTSGTGGTPPTFTATAAAASGTVPNATNLSAEIVQFGAILSQL